MSLADFQNRLDAFRYSPDQARGPDGRFGEGGGGPTAAQEAKQVAHASGKLGAQGVDHGDPASQPREEALRQAILKPIDDAEKHVAASNAKANALIAKHNAGDKSVRGAAESAIRDAKAAQANLTAVRLASASEAHKLIAVANGARVQAMASGHPLANNAAEAKSAGQFIAKHVAKDAAPSNIRISVLQAGDKETIGTFAGKEFSGRAHADPIPGQRIITVNPDVKAKTITHEFGHVMEAESGAHFKAAVDFLTRRTGLKDSGDLTAATRPLSEITGNSVYGPKEKALDDHFQSAYVGKVYGASGPGSYKGFGATEVTSMGMERMHNDPVEFAREDPDHFRFTLEQMNRKATPR